MNDLKVYILGAGCSVGCGYPLATGFVSVLEEFSADLARNPGCAKIKRACDETVRLLKEHGANTVDDLVARLGAQARDSSQVLTINERQRLDRQVDAAKIATYAFFLHLESQARTKLSRYDNFLREILGQPPQWRRSLATSKVRVLTFNYDRLFELAFSRGCNWVNHQPPLYGHQYLNAGFDYSSGTGITFAPDRFAFLKLHGSVGIRSRIEEGWDQDEHGGALPTYDTKIDGSPSQYVELTDERLLGQHNHPNPYERYPKPLIVFPHEKPFVPPGNQTLLHFRDYIPAVWEEAKRICQQATEIRFIGYSFAPMDWNYVFPLLEAAQGCKQLIVQNRPGTAERICGELWDKNRHRLPRQPEPSPMEF